MTPVDSQGTSVPKTLLSPESLIGGVRVLQPMGGSRASELWRASDVSTQRDVTIKVFSPEYCREPAKASRLKTHLEKLTALKHAHLAQVVRYGEHEGMIYVVSEWVQESLGQWVTQNGPLPFSVACAMLLQLCEALSFTWSQGLAHGTLKPQNILLEDGSAKIADLGLGWLSLGSEGAKGWKFLAPEALAHAASVPTLSSDLYSLGATLFFALTGEYAFSPRSVEDVQTRCQGQAVPEPESLRELCNGDVLMLIKRLMEIKPSERLTSYSQLEACLAALEVDVPLSSLPFIHKLSQQAKAGSATQSSRAAAQPQQGPSAAPPVENVAEPREMTYELEEEPSYVFHEQEATLVLGQTDSEEVVQEEVAPPVEPEAAPAPQAPAPVAPPPAAPAEVTDERGKEILQALSRARRQRLMLVAALAVIVLLVAGVGFHMMHRTDIGAKANPERAQSALPALKATPAGSVEASPSPAPGTPVSLASAAEAAPTTPTPRAELKVSALPPLGSASGGAAAEAPAVSLAGGAQAAQTPIIVDDDSKDGLACTPEGAWQVSKGARKVQGATSLIARIDGARKTAVFQADIPVAGKYEVFLSWISAPAAYRSTKVPVSVHASTGRVQLHVDQVNTESAFNSLGTYTFAAGQKQPVVDVSTEGLDSSLSAYVSIDGLKLVKVAD